MIIGELKELRRYPVKSFGGEMLSEAKVEPYGLYGDRSHAIIDGSQIGWDRFVTARDIPEMISYQAAFESNGHPGEFPLPRIKDRDGIILEWGNRLLERLQPQYKRPLSLETQLPSSQDLMAVDEASILIVTDSSLRELERKWGKRLDPARFRANFLFALDDDRPFAETQWTNRRLQVGSASFMIDKPCDRCLMVALDPDTYEKDITLLKLLQKETEIRFGMYASVVQPGVVKVGDKAELL